MDDGYPAPADTLSARLRARLQAGPARQPLAPHHRRRRAAALGVVAALALVVGVVAGASSGGGSADVTKATATRGYLHRISTLAGNGAGSFAVAQRAAENAAITRTLAYTPYVRIAGTQHKEIALTFDDGPGPYTPQVLSVLERLHAPATFFEVGVEERYFHDSTAKIVAAATRSVTTPRHTRHGPADRQAAAVPAAAGDGGDRQPRCAVPAHVPPALRPVGQDHAEASARSTGC